MTRAKHTLEEQEVFELWTQMAKSYCKKYDCDENHVDKPDFILIHKKNKKKVGVEIVGLHNSKITESKNAHEKRESTAHNNLLDAIRQKKTYTLYLVESFPTEELFKDIIGLEYTI